MSGAWKGEVEVCAVFLASVLIADGGTQVHVQMLGRKAFAPLHEQADRVSLYLEAGALKGGGGVLNGGRTVTDADRNVKQGRIDEHLFPFCRSVLAEVIEHGLLIEVVYGLCHAFSLLGSIIVQLLVVRDCLGYSSQRTGYAGCVRVKEKLGRVAQRKDQPPGNLVHNLAEGVQGGLWPHSQHYGKQAPCKRTWPLLQKLQGTAVVYASAVYAKAFVEFTLPYGIIVFVEHVQQFCKPFKTRLAGVFAEP